MSEPINRGTKAKPAWQQVIRIKGHPTMCETFTTSGAAKKWRDETTQRIKSSGSTKFGELRETPVADLLKAYRDEVCVKHKGWSAEFKRINAWVGVNLAGEVIGKPMKWARCTLDNPTAITTLLQEWRDQRLAPKTEGGGGIIPDSFARELSVLKSAFKYAMKEWQMPLAFNPADRVVLPPMQNNERDRLWTDEELVIWMKDYKWSIDKAPKKNKDYVPWAIQIIRNTGWRPSEILRVELEDIKNGKYVYYDTTKNGADFQAPMNAAAQKLILALAAHQEAAGQKRLFPVKWHSIQRNFQRHRENLAKKYPEMADLILYAQRHTFTTKLCLVVEDKMEVMKMTGRKSMQVLGRYYKPDPNKLADSMPVV